MEIMTQKRNRQTTGAALRQAIVAGGFKPGQKLMSTRELSERYGVAVKTAHEALGDLVREGLLVRTPGKGTFIAEPRPEPQAATARSVALLLSPDQHLWGDLSHCLTKELWLRGYRATLIPPERLADDADWAEFLAEGHLALVVPDLGLAENCLRRNPQVKVIALMADFVPGFPGDVIWVDSYQSAYDGTRRLASLGLTRIGCCGNGILHPTPPGGWLGEAELLRQGYLDALRDAKLEPDQLVDPVALLGEGRSMTDHFRERGFPQAFFCGSDHRAANIADAAKELGLRVPEDLKLIGVNNTPWAEAYSLTSFDSRPDLIAHECGKLLDDLAEKGGGSPRHHRVMIRSALVVRQSCP